MPTVLPKRYDLAVVGGGIFGLSIAYEALQQGMSVVVLEADKVGAGSSGGLLGALMPHMPARWNPKKEFQFQALSSLEAHARVLEAETGLTTGYKRCGRILPLTTRDKLDHHIERAEEALDRWQPQSTGFSYEVEPAGSRSDWLCADAAPFGIVYETLAARISPRAYLGALATYVRDHGLLLEGTVFDGYDEASGSLHLSTMGQQLAADRLVLASGPACFKQIEAFTGEMIGRGEKGQALRLEGAGLENHPAIYCDGLYVVPHDDGTIAVGSTSDRDFTTATVDPERTDELIRRATAFCPALKGRELLTVWAGIRPRCNKRDALVGQLPNSSRVFAATGGFKISFGIAHLIAKCLVADLMGQESEISLPPSYLPGHHFSEFGQDHAR
ncbi:FAD-binding oxidoreductase [Roseibium polysiphoniae]|uniref:FAD-binding oxidoreductase n=1 Tax=Roseibium polysiphoniae TaxID=2571221 RepID=A0A944GRI5_9HYPH|nr:FAD-dependent oxidoreductase [Roseibium polysiphoniae]MBS8258625.1 FAD-binding oxidoreductase [Roseibium polysiphoniae]